jgi:hypothetical protein
MHVRKKLIYIYGLGRSGSTLTGQILGQAEDSRCLGEFLRFTSIDDLSRSGHSDDTQDVRSLPCGCGKLGMDCKENALNRYLSENNLFKVHKWFSLSSLHLPAESELTAYFNSVKKILDSYPNQVIIDTSKNPRILYLLSRSELFRDYDVRGVFVYRNVLKVWESWRTTKGYLQKKSRLTILKNISAGLFWSVLIYMMRKRTDTFINFDVLRSNPQKVVNQLNEVLDIKIPLSGREIPLINESHEVAGNPSKLENVDRITIH